MDNGKLYNQLYDLTSTLLTVDEKTPNEVEEIVKNMLEPLQNFFGETVDLEQLMNKALAENKIWVGKASILSDDGKNHEEWLNNEYSSIDWCYWRRYRKYLSVFEHFSPSAIKEIDDSTTTILGLLESPQRDGTWDRRGMVVGCVQAGKTADYIGLICKAVDAGYKVIIVLAGVSNDLRSQTQSRIDSGFVGLDTSKRKNQNQSTVLFGAGTIANYSVPPLSVLTSSAMDGDFKKGVYDNVIVPPGGNPVVLVIKKNTTPLKNVYEYFSKLSLSGKTSKSSLLLIDDEADNASIDTNAISSMENGSDLEEQNPTAINGYIRKILNIFPQSSYVGYTATPFANIFINPDSSSSDSDFGEDLFPRNFIVNLEAPSNYLGSERLFGLSKDVVAGIEEEKRPLPLIRPIDDYERIIPANHKKSLKVLELPYSLKEAIFAFILSNAVRNVRKNSKKHQSMLIHVTRFNDVQHQITLLVSEFVKKLVAQFEVRTGSSYEENYKKIKELWIADFVKTSSKVKEEEESERENLPDVCWEQIKDVLFYTISKIQVKEINGAAKDAGINYNNFPHGCSVIAVGGDKLSRGLTLEGLSVSYYTRPSKNYDTLLQMGRWFGFRAGYLDVCRLYTSTTNIKAYRHIAVADFELRKELVTMAMLNETPESYGLKIRTDPEGQLRITAYNKMRNSADVSVAFAGKTLQVTSYYRDNKVNSANVEFLAKWLLPVKQNLEKTRTGDSAYIYRNISASAICDFILGIEIHRACFNRDAVVSYIKQQNQHTELVNWTVALICPSSAGMSIDINGRNVGLNWRTDAAADLDTQAVYMINNRLIKGFDEKIDLTPEEQRQAFEFTKKSFVQTAKRQAAPTVASPTWIKRIRKPQNGLLLIYPFKSGVIEKGQRKPYDQVYVGYAISFPASPTAKPVNYKADSVSVKKTLHDEFGIDDEL